MVGNDRAKVKFNCYDDNYEELTLEDIHRINMKRIGNPKKLVQDIKTEILDIKDANNKRGRGLPSYSRLAIDRMEETFGFIASSKGFQVIGKSELIARFGPYDGVKGEFNLVLDKIYYSLDRINFDYKKYQDFWPETETIIFLIYLHVFKNCVEQRGIRG